jgi:minor extracellular serine protease Vpr
MRKREFAKLQAISFLPLLLSLMLILSSIAYAFPEKVQNKSMGTPILSSQKVTVLIELKDPSTIALQTQTPFSIHHPMTIQHQETLQSRQEEVLKQISLQNIPFKPIGSLKHTFNGLIVEVAEYHLPLISTLPTVKKCMILEDLFDLDRWAAGVSLHVLNPSSRNIPYTGKGTRIGIIDTGVDYLHEDFTPPGIRGENTKTVDGDDFADDIYEEDVLKEDDQDPMDDAIQHGGHGTHVAGIAGGNHPSIPEMPGIAPDASLYAYKVFSSNPKAGGAQGAHIVMAVERSIEDECTVINLSLGHRARKMSDYEDSPYITVFQRAVDAGVIVVATAGNNGSRFLEEGLDNESPMSAPGTFDSVIQVAASDDRHFRPITLQFQDSREVHINAQQSYFTPSFPEHFAMLEIVNAGYGRKEDLEGMDLTGKIALISRGPVENAITFREKNLNAKEAGAAACIIYNYDLSPFLAIMITDGDIVDPWSLELLPTLSVTSMGGQYLKEFMITGLKMELAPRAVTSIADFTSAGPSPDGLSNQFKPELCAPGTSIYSSLPSSLSKEGNKVQWGSRQGTSMAAPVVTGSIALLKEARPWLSPAQCKALLMNTAELLTNPLNGEVFSFLYQGSGQINVEAALDSPIIAMPPAFMRSFDDKEKAISLEIENFSEERVFVDLRSVIYDGGELADKISISLDKPFIELAPQSKENLQLWVQLDEELSILKKIEGVLWLDVHSSINTGGITHNLHVPFILYQAETFMEIEKAVAQVELSSEKLDINENPSLSVSFQLNTGSQVRTTDKEGKQTINVRNYASRFSIHIEDQEGNNLGTIYYSELMPIGKYHLGFNGRNILNHWFLEDGAYRMVFSLHCLLYNSDTQERKLLMLAMAEEQFELSQSPLSIPVQTLLSLPRLMENNRRYSMKLYVLDFKDIRHIQANILFPSAWQNLLLIPGEDQLDESHLWKENEDGRRVLHIEALRRQVLAKESWQALEISFTYHTEELPELPELDIQLSDEHKIPRKVLIELPKMDSYLDKMKVLDLNQDGKIDNLDAVILLQHYGLNYQDREWNPAWDLNNDWKLDLEDLKLFAYFVP